MEFCQNHYYLSCPNVNYIIKICRLVEKAQNNKSNPFTGVGL